MPSQFFGLMIGYSGLTAAQVAQNTTANNIANINTDGYSRQKLNTEAADALRTYTTYGMAGAGVKSKSIDQIRNEYVDMKYRVNQSLVGEYSKKQTYTLELENYFVDTDTVPGFNTIYTDNFYNALSDLEDDPGSTTTRTAFLGRTQSLVEYFNEMAQRMESVQENMNNELKDGVDKINDIAAQISSLNQQINVIEIKGVVANELRDQRALLIDELSNYVNVETAEMEVFNYSDPDNPTGAKRFIVNISNGCTLVDGYEFNELECKAREKKVNQSDIEGLYDIYWKTTGTKFAPLAENQSGEIKSLLELRDGNNKEFFDGEAKAGAAVGDTTLTVTGPSGDFEKIEISDSGMLNVSGIEYYYDSWKYEEADKTFTFSGIRYYDAEGIEHEGFHDAVKLNDTVRIGQALNYQGVPYYQAQMNEWVRGFAYAFNGIMEQGYDLNGDSMKGISFFQVEDVNGAYHDVEPSDVIGSAGGTDYTFNNMTAKNLRLNADIRNDAALFATTFDKESVKNPDSNDLVVALSSIKTDKSKMTFRGCSSAEFLACLTSDVALNAQSAITFTKNYTNISNSLSNQRLSESGVDQDEEALNLVKFQHAFELNSKVIQTMTEMYDRLILNTGV